MLVFAIIGALTSIVVLIIFSVVTKTWTYIYEWTYVVVGFIVFAFFVGTLWSFGYLFMVGVTRLCK